jgi:uncharacterized RDD family membrane protein YckC
VSGYEIIRIGRNESNNLTISVKTRNITSSSPLRRRDVDLAVARNDITLLNESKNGEVTVNVKIRNEGKEQANNVKVLFFKYSFEEGLLEKGLKKIDSITTDIPGKSHKAVNISWNTENGSYNFIAVLIDPQNDVEEKIEYNNYIMRNYREVPFIVPENAYKDFEGGVDNPLGIEYVESKFKTNCRAYTVLPSGTKIVVYDFYTEKNARKIYNYVVYRKGPPFFHVKKENALGVPYSCLGTFPSVSRDRYHVFFTIEGYVVDVIGSMSDVKRIAEDTYFLNSYLEPSSGSPPLHARIPSPKEEGLIIIFLSFLGVLLRKSLSETVRVLITVTKPLKSLDKYILKFQIFPLFRYEIQKISISRFGVFLHSTESKKYICFFFPMKELKIINREAFSNLLSFFSLLNDRKFFGIFSISFSLMVIIALLFDHFILHGWLSIESAILRFGLEFLIILIVGSLVDTIVVGELETFIQPFSHFSLRILSMLMFLSRVDQISYAKSVTTNGFPATKYPQKGGKSVFCPRCGIQLKEGDRFCSSCGTRISELGMGKAGTGARFVSYIFDGIIVTAVGWVLIFIFWAIARDIGGVGSIMSLLFSLGYFTYFFGNGQTPGMKLAKIKLCGTDGTYPIGYRKGFLRWIGMIISVFVIGLGFFWILIDENKQGWHDKIAGTSVVVE